jgi:hypothetical protein
MRTISFSADTFKPFLEDDFEAEKYAAKLISSIRTYVDPDKREVNRGYEVVLAEHCPGVEKLLYCCSEEALSRLLSGIQLLDNELHTQVTVAGCRFYEKRF